MKNILKYCLGICFVLTSVLSCSNNETDTLFDESPAERIDGNNKKLLNLLTGEVNGYKGVYFTKDDEFGGFTFYMKFNTDGTVIMTSDFDSETAIESSSYDVRLGTTGSELVFTTRNHIQKVSNSLAPGVFGISFKGTSVFQFFSDENGVLTFKDIRNKELAHFVLTPSGLNDFNKESVIKVNTSLAQRNNFLPLETEPVFQILSIKNGANTTSFNLSYNNVKLFANSKLVANDGKITELNFGIAYTEKGLIVSPAIDFGGQTYTVFTYDSSTRSYISTVNGTTATISFNDFPAFIGDDILKLPSYDGAGFYHVPFLGANPLTSKGHDKLLALINANLNAQGYTLDYYLMVTNFTSNDACKTFLGLQVVRNSTGQAYRAKYCFDKPVIQDKKLFLKYLAPLDNNSRFFEASVKPLIDFFESNKGLIYTNEGSFTSDLYSYPNDAATYASLEDPTLRVYGIWVSL